MGGCRCEMCGSIIDEALGPKVGPDLCKQCDISIDSACSMGPDERGAITTQDIMAEAASSESFPILNLDLGDAGPPPAPFGLPASLPMPLPVVVEPPKPINITLDGARGGKSSLSLRLDFDDVLVAWERQGGRVSRDGFLTLKEAYCSPGSSPTASGSSGISSGDEGAGRGASAKYNREKRKTLPRSDLKPKARKLMHSESRPRQNGRFARKAGMEEDVYGLPTGGDLVTGAEDETSEGALSLGHDSLDDAMDFIHLDAPLLVH